MSAEVIWSDVRTLHGDELGLAARLAACCTFYYAGHRDSRYQSAMARREFRGTVDAWIVHTPGAPATWRVVDPSTWIEEDGDLVIPYAIDGRSSEGEVARELLKLIAVATANHLDNARIPHASASATRAPKETE